MKSVRGHRVGRIARGDDFPAPMAHLQAGRVWLADEVDEGPRHADRTPGGRSPEAAARLGRALTEQIVPLGHALRRVSPVTLSAFLFGVVLTWLTQALMLCGILSGVYAACLTRSRPTTVADLAWMSFILPTMTIVLGGGAALFLSPGGEITGALVGMLLGAGLAVEPWWKRTSP